MRPFFVIVVFEFLAQEVHVFVAKNDEMVETFLLDRLNESFGKGDHVRDRIGVRWVLIFPFSNASMNNLEYFASLSSIRILHFGPPVFVDSINVVAC